MLSTQISIRCNFPAGHRCDLRGHKLLRQKYSVVQSYVNVILCKPVAPSTGLVKITGNSYSSVVKGERSAQVY